MLFPSIKKKVKCKGLWNSVRGVPLLPLDTPNCFQPYYQTIFPSQFTKAGINVWVHLRKFAEMSFPATRTLTSFSNFEETMSKSSRQTQVVFIYKIILYIFQSYLIYCTFWVGKNSPFMYWVCWLKLKIQCCNALRGYSLSGEFDDST